MKELKKIIACLDMKDGRVVKGINFVDFVDVADPAVAAEIYTKQGADELVLLDIAATNEKRDTMIDVVKKTAAKAGVPFTVGGGIRSVEDIEKILNAGANGISINSAAVYRPELINEAVAKFGSDKITIAVDAKRYGDKYLLHVDGGLRKIDKDAIEWAKEAAQRGCGKILVTSVDTDGMKTGYDLDLTGQIADAVNIPVIASGGAGKLSDFYDVFTKTKVQSALAASLFHFNEINIMELKKYLFEKGIEVNYNA